MNIFKGRFGKAAFLTTLLVALASNSNTAFANPSDAKLDFTWRTNGSLAVNVKFDKVVTTRCFARHKSSLYYEGAEAGDKGVIVQATHTRFLPPGRKSTSLRAFGLPGVVQKNGQDPIIATQVAITCSKSPTIYSNIQARFVKCGLVQADRVSLASFLKQLKQKLQFSK